MMQQTLSLHVFTVLIKPVSRDRDDLGAAHAQRVIARVSMASPLSDPYKEKSWRVREKAATAGLSNETS
ncbi:MAG: hypothetical protein U1D30_10855 [Planctomycetota bacterium]